MSPNPQAFLTHLTEHRYHPRSDKHSNALADAIVGDLLRHCTVMAEAAVVGRIVYSKNVDVRAGTADWNVDLVIGAAPLAAEAPEKGRIQAESPASVQIAIEIKSVMTEHRKAVKNRKRDLEAHHEHVHNVDRNAIAAGVLVINAADRFQSPLRRDATVHRNPDRLVEHCISELRSVASRGGATGYGLEAKCAIVLAHTNLEGDQTRYVTRRPAPEPGDPLHYDSFVRRICDLYRERFGT